MTISSYLASAIENGYVFECPCGELARHIHVARRCRKCRVYTPEFAGEWVVDIRTDECVHGVVPSQEEVTRREEARRKLELAIADQARKEFEAAEKAELDRRREEAEWRHFFRWERKAEELGF